MIIQDGANFLSEAEVAFLESKGHEVRKADLSIEGYLKGVQKALLSWSQKDISDEDKIKIKKILKCLKS